MIEQIEQELKELDGVDFVHITANKSGVYDKKTALLPMSFKLYVRGGKKKEIANVIRRYKIPGALTAGNTKVKIKVDWLTYIINFERLL